MWSLSSTPIRAAASRSVLTVLTVRPVLTVPISAQGGSRSPLSTYPAESWLTRSTQIQLAGGWGAEGAAVSCCKGITGGGGGGGGPADAEEKAGPRDTGAAGRGRDTGLLCSGGPRSGNGS